MIWRLSDTLPPGVLLLNPGQSATAAIYWANWCQANPGALDIAIHLAAGTVTGPFDGPPDYNYTPDCTNPAGSSTLQVTQSYQLQTP